MAHVAITDRVPPQARDALLRYVRKARKQGFSIAAQTYTPWSNAIAAPIRHPKTQEVSGVAVIAGPAIRFTEPRMETLVPELLSAARELSLTPTTTSVLKEHT